MPYAHVNGQRLYYEDTGGDGPAILFSHGLLMDGSMFAAQVQAQGGRELWTGGVDISELDTLVTESEQEN